MAELRVTTLEIARLRFDLAATYDLPTDHPAAGTEPIPVQAFHLALPGRSVLVDAPAYDEADTPAVYLLPGYQAPPPLIDQLRARGVEPETVTDVIVTHAHFDHYTGLAQDDGGGPRPAFPAARHVLGRGDWDPEALGELGGRTLGVVARAGLLTLIEGDADLGDGLGLIAAPGESPGHLLVRAQVEGDVAYVVGDLYHHAVEFGEPDLDVRWADATAMRASKRALMERAAREGARVYFSHIAGAHRVRRVGDAFRWEPVGPS